MADNRIRVLIDVVKDNASKNLSSLRKDFAEADGAAAKFKVGAGGAMDFVKVNAGAMALGAGAALATFGAKAVSAFQDTALAAGQFADTTGMAIQDSSRWMAVFKPLNIELGDAQDVFNNLASLINANDAAFKQLGVTIAKDQQGRVDMNETVIRIAESLGKVADPARKAALMAKFFGEEGARQFGPLIADADELREKLEAVSDQKVIDPEELKRAEKMRDGIRKLKSAGEDLTLAVGGALVPVIAELGEVASDVVGPFTELTNALDGTDFSAKEAGSSLFGFAKSVVDTAFNINTTRDALEEHNQKVDEAHDAFVDLGDESKRASVALYRSARATEELGDETEETTDAIVDLTAGIDILNGALSRDDAKASFIEAQQEMRDAALGSAEDQVAATRRALDATVRYIDTLGGIPERRATQIAALIDQGSLAEAERQLAIMARNRTVSVGIVTRGGAGYDGGISGRRAAGGPVSAGQAYIVGEQGPEVMVAGSNGMVVPNRALGGGGNSYSITVNVAPGADTVNVGRQLVECIKDYERVNSARWRAS